MTESHKQSPQEGEMFRLNYLRPASPLSDSPRARIRLSRLFENALNEAAQAQFVKAVEELIGIRYPFAVYGYDHRALWEKADIGDILSAVTIAYIGSYDRKQFLNHARRIFAEEHLRYRLDDKGGVHFVVDAEFERNVATTLQSLGAPWFASARHAFETALTSLGTTNQSGKALIRGIFEAVESAFLAVIGNADINRLNAATIDKHLKPILAKRYNGVPEAEDKIDRSLETMKAWVKSAHPYRHGAALEQIHEAPLDLAILSASQGIGFLRYLASLRAEKS